MSNHTKPKRRRIGFFLFDGVTALDLTGPAEAFACAAFPGSGKPAYEVLTVGVSRRACVSESGVALTPSCTIGDAPALDTLIVPGGAGFARARDESQGDRVDRAVRAAHPQDRVRLHRNLWARALRAARRAARHDALALRCRRRGAVPEARSRSGRAVREIGQLLYRGGGNGRHRLGARADRGRSRRRRVARGRARARRLREARRRPSAILRAVALSELREEPDVRARGAHHRELEARPARRRARGQDGGLAAPIQPAVLRELRLLAGRARAAAAARRGAPPAARARRRDRARRELRRVQQRGRVPPRLRAGVRDQSVEAIARASSCPRKPLAAESGRARRRPTAPADRRRVVLAASAAGGPRRRPVRASRGDPRGGLDPPVWCPRDSEAPNALEPRSAREIRKSQGAGGSKNRGKSI